MHLKIEDDIGSILKAKAGFFDYRAKGRDSVVGLLRAIALQEMSLIKTEEIKKLQQQLIENNRYQLAEALASISFIPLEEKPIIQQIKKKIYHQLPFRLSYIDAAGKAFVFDCNYAQISTYENKQYLEVSFTNEVESDSPEPLKTNRCLRLDRVPEDSRLKGMSDLEWGELSYIEVSFKLFGNLAYSYRQEPDDRVRLTEDGAIVTRKISNDFFFIRQMLCYGDKCEIVSPDFMRQKMIATFQQAFSLYDCSA